MVKAYRYRLHPDEEQVKYAIVNQKDDSTSTLNRVRQAIINRKNSVFHEFGDVNFLKQEKQKGVIAFVRSNKEKTHQTLCLFNFSEVTAEVTYLNKVYEIAPETAIYKNI